MKLEDIENQIKELETAWKRYHKDDRKYDMPDMVELVKLRIARDNIKKNV